VLLTRSIAPSNHIYIILDASGSMLDEMGGRTKFDIARDAVAGLVNELPENSQVALRVYGSKKRAIEVDADSDTELLIPLGALDRAKFLAALRPLRARGKTPLAQSLHDATSDLNAAASEATAENPITVLLLTDGGEDTRPRKDPVRAAAELAKLKNVQIKIVGFDINREDWTSQLHAHGRCRGWALLERWRRRYPHAAGARCPGSRPRTVSKSLKQAVSALAPASSATA
jgi:Mg-chelatase subunit ChlD